jgi:hypothetical protein
MVGGSWPREDDQRESVKELQYMIAIFSVERRHHCLQGVKKRLQIIDGNEKAWSYLGQTRCDAADHEKHEEHGVGWYAIPCVHPCLLAWLRDEKHSRAEQLSPFFPFCHTSHNKRFGSLLLSPQQQTDQLRHRQQTVPLPEHLSST